MHRYVVQTRFGLKYRPGSIQELEELVQRGWITPTTMVLSQSSAQWRLAASYPEIRDLLRNHPHHPSASRLYSPSKSAVRSGAGLVPPPMAEKSPRASSVAKQACVVSGKPHLSRNVSMELYTIRGSDGVEYGPCALEQVKELVKQGRVKATTMVFTQSTQRWHLAASVAEVRVFLRQYNPSQDSTLDRIRSVGNAKDSAHAMMAIKRISTVRVKHPFWKRFFGR